MFAIIIRNSKKSENLPQTQQMGEEGENRPVILVTNDDGIEAPGLRALVRALVAADRYRILVAAPHM